MCIRDRPKLETWISKRTAIAERYRDALGDLNGLTLPTADDGHSWNQFVVRIGSCPTGQPLCKASCNPSNTSAHHGIPESCCRDWVKQTLQERGVNTIIYYPIPIHRQPAYAHLGLKQGSLPVTEQLCSDVLSLPIFPELGEGQQQAVIDTVRQLLAANAPAQFDRGEQRDQDRMVA